MPPPPLEINERTPMLHVHVYSTQADIDKCGKLHVYQNPPKSKEILRCDGEMQTNFNKTRVNK